MPPVSPARARSAIEDLVLARHPSSRRFRSSGARSRRALDQRDFSGYQDFSGLVGEQRLRSARPYFAQAARRSSAVWKRPKASSTQAACNCSWNRSGEADALSSAVNLVQTEMFRPAGQPPGSQRRRRPAGLESQIAERAVPNGRPRSRHSNKSGPSGNPQRTETAAAAVGSPQGGLSAESEVHSFRGSHDG